MSKEKEKNNFVHDISAIRVLKLFYVVASRRKSRYFLLFACFISQDVTPFVWVS
jgi:hypothetical protein